MNIYLQGLTMGLAYVAPIGLQNLFVINSALTQKRSRVYITALIVILWDVSLGVACFLGAGALMQAVPWLQKVILGLGSLIVIYIGIGLLRAKASLEGGKDGGFPGHPAGRGRPALHLRFRQRFDPLVPDPLHGGVAAGQQV